MAPAPSQLKRVMLAAMPLLLGLALSGCSTAENAGPTPGLVGRKILSPGEQQIIVNGGGREIRSLVLLPAGFRPGRTWPLLLAIHNFGGDAAGFAKLIHADRLTRSGILVLLPEAAGWIPEWQGPGVTITVGVRQPDGKRIDDTSGIAETLAVARRLFPIDPADINVAGFSQGATVAIALTRRLDDEQPAMARPFGSPLTKTIRILGRRFVVQKAANLLGDVLKRQPNYQPVNYQEMETTFA